MRRAVAVRQQTKHYFWCGKLMESLPNPWAHCLPLTQFNTVKSHSNLHRCFWAIWPATPRVAMVFGCEAENTAERHVTAEAVRDAERKGNTGCTCLTRRFGVIITCTCETVLKLLQRAGRLGIQLHFKNQTVSETASSSARTIASSKIRNGHLQI